MNQKALLYFLTESNFIVERKIRTERHRLAAQQGETQ